MFNPMASHMFHNPKQITDSGLLDLNMGPVDEIASASGLRDVVFTGRMDKWAFFYQDVSHFYYNPTLVDAFTRCQDAPAGINLYLVSSDIPDFADLR
jgi:hypothetical protein